MYFVVRCGLVHEAEIPDTQEFTQDALISVRDGRLTLPAGFIYGLIVAVIASPANAGEQSETHYQINVDGEALPLHEFWGRSCGLESIIFGKRNERIAKHYRNCAGDWAKRVVDSRSILDLLVWAYLTHQAASAVMKMLPRDNAGNPTACVVPFANVDAERGSVGSAWSFVSKELGNAGGIGINPDALWELAMCAYGVVDFRQRQDLKPVYDAFKAELRNNDQQRRANGGTPLIDTLVATLHERFPTVAAQLPKPRNGNRPSQAAVTKSTRRSSPFMSLTQLGIALDLDYRRFKSIAQIEWELKPENERGTLWSINFNLLNDAGFEERIVKHAANLTAEREKKRQVRAAK